MLACDEVRQQGAERVVRRDGEWTVSKWENAGTSDPGLLLDEAIAALSAAEIWEMSCEDLATHVRVGDPFFVPIIIGVVAWVALGLRDPRVFAMAFGKPAIDSPAG